MIRRLITPIVASVAILSILPIYADEKQMNVLMILVDDMNDWIEPLGGNEQAITPNIQSLAERGMLFTNAHTSSPACHPSRVALMTGVQPARSGVDMNVFAKGEVTWRKVPMLSNVTTMSQHFRNNGYEALCGGKIYHTLQGNPSDENDYSTWDVIMPGDEQSGSPIAFQPRASKKNVDFNEEVGLCPNRIMSWAPTDCDVDEMADNQLVDWAIERLREERSKPFFMAVGIFRPHLPWEVPQRFFDMYPLDEVRIPQGEDPRDLEDTYNHRRRHWHKWVVDNDIWRTGVQGYLASISYADYEIGRLMDALDGSGKADNTIIVFWSDHGMHIGEKENWEKFTLFEESTRIPIIVSDPRVEPGRTNAPVTSIDLFPTLIELTGTTAQVPNTLDGESMANLVAGGDEDFQPAISSYKETHSVRTRTYRYIYCEAEGTEELYDHSVDQKERTNIAYLKSSRKILDKLRGLLREHAEVNVPSGYEVPEAFVLQEGGLVKRRQFELLEDVRYVVPKWWKSSRRTKTIEKLKKDGVPYIDDEE